MIRLTKESWKYFDIPIAATVVALFCFSIAILGNITGSPDVDRSAGLIPMLASMDFSVMGRQALWFFLGILMCGAAMMLDYHFYGDAVHIIYWITVLILAGTLVVAGTINGAKAWLGSNKLGVQPSEFAKLTLILFLAKFLSKKPDGIRTIRELLQILFFVGILVGLVILQNDLGSALVYIFITIVMLFVAGLDWKLLVGMGVVGTGMLIPLWSVLSDYQKKRFLVFLDPTLDPLNAGFNVRMSKMAVGSGRMRGRGFFDPTSLVQNNFIPVPQSDFIFAATAETLGFWGTSVILLLYCFLIIRLLVVSRRSFDRFGSYVIIGFTAMLSFHIFENIGMTLGVMPVTGIPLPFFSAGGSSMWANLIGIGLVMNVLMRRNRGMFKEGDIY